MSYAVKELFLTLQGEGGQAGRAAVFCRFAGCNLWSGREEDRAAAAWAVHPDEIRVAEGADGGRAVGLAPAPQVAAGEAAEHGGAAGLPALALECVEDLFDGI